MCAYELIDCSSQEKAIALASQHLMAKVATIEAPPEWNELVD
jgi:hypothetical protein